MKLDNVKIDSQLKRFVYQNVLAMVGLSAYVLADTFFISVAGGTNGITALNLCLPAYNIMNAIAAMIGIGHATLYSIYRAEEREGYDKLFLMPLHLNLYAVSFLCLSEYSDLKQFLD
jgi:Na+-driven multidrug efflux pump